MLKGEIKMNKLTLKELQMKSRMLDLVLQEKLHPSINDIISVYYTDAIYDKKETCFYLLLNDEYLHNPVTYPSEISREDIIKIAKDMIDQYRNTCDLEELDMELKGEVPCKQFKNKYSSCNECPRCMINTTNKEDACMGVVYSPSSSFDSYQFKEINFKDKWTDKYGENSTNHKKFATKKLCNEIWNFSSVCDENEEYLTEVINSLFKYCNEDKVKKILKNIIKE